MNCVACHDNLLILARCTYLRFVNRHESFAYSAQIYINIWNGNFVRWVDA